MTTFEVLIDDTFESVCTEEGLQPIANKKVFSVINTFEDEKWRYQSFQNYIWDNIAETALSAKERASLSERRQTFLVEAAKNLRLIDSDKDDRSKGSEIAEIVLYGMMKDYYKALPVVPKIFYKQNTQDFAKGSDSVHIVLEEGNIEFSLWFGEAKFYNDIADTRLDKIIESVENSLTTEKLRKENVIITNLAELDELDIDASLRKNIRDLLSSDTSMDEIKPRLHIPILLLHECKITGKSKRLSTEYREAIKSFHEERATAYFKKQITQLSDKITQYSEIKFHILLFPVPSKKQVVDKFLTRARDYREKE